MKWDESIKDPAAVEKAIIEKKPICGIYLICNTKKRKTMIMSMSEAFKKLNAPLEIKVIGAAKGKNEAFMLLADMYAVWLKSHDTVEGFVDSIG